jgi:transposase InsO family protein
MAAKVLSMQTKLVAALAESTGAKVNVSALCRELGVSRKHYYALKRRFAAGGVEAVLAGESRRPKTSPGQLPVAVEDEIVRWRKTLADDGWDAGARSIRFKLVQDGFGPLPAVSTIHRVLRRRGLVVDAPKKRPRAAMIRFEYLDPNGCWQLDGMEWPLADGTKACVLKVIDDHSRKVMGMRAAAGENLEDAWACISDAMDIHGPPVRALSDRGRALNGDPARQSQFRERLRRRGVQPISSRGYHPQTCGKTERSHQTLQRWLARQPPARSLEELQQLLDQFTEKFNTSRAHQALGGDTPQQRYTAKPKAAPPGAVTAERATVTTVLVSGRGEVASREHTIQVGRRWEGCRGTVMREDLNVVILSNQEVIRRLVIDPDKRYQGNGRPYPASPKPHPRKVLPMSRDIP